MRKTVLAITLVLLLIVGITAYLNRDSIADKKDLQEQAIILVKEEGKEVKQLSFDLVKEQGEHTFNKELDTSESGPEPHTFTGVPLKNIFAEVGVELAGKEQVIVKAIDGYTVALTARETLADDNVYLVYKSDGEFLQGKSEGGTGPYRIVIKEDQFGQRWCKFVTEVDVK